MGMRAMCGQGREDTCHGSTEESTGITNNYAENSAAALPPARPQVLRPQPPPHRQLPRVPASAERGKYSATEILQQCLVAGLSTKVQPDPQQKPVASQGQPRPMPHVMRGACQALHTYVEKRVRADSTASSRVAAKPLCLLNKGAHCIR